jgi:hypothetical protein
MCLCGNVEKIIEERKKLFIEWGPFKDWPAEVKQEFFEFREESNKSCIASDAFQIGRTNI